MDKHRIGLKEVLPVICSMYFTEVGSLAVQNFIDFTEKAWVELSKPSKNALGNSVKKQDRHYFFWSRLRFQYILVSFLGT